MRFLLIFFVLLLPMVSGKEERKYNYTNFDKYQRWCRAEGFPQDYNWIDYTIRVLGLSLLSWQFVMLCILGMMNMDVTTDDDDWDVDLDVEQVSLATETSSEVIILDPDEHSNNQSQNEEPMSDRPESQGTSATAKTTSGSRSAEIGHQPRTH